jgi:hypothetical protein
MSEVNNKSFSVPLAGTDPITKGTFTITWGHMLWSDSDDEDFPNPRVRGDILIRGNSNPLYIVGKESPLRLQGLVASVMFGVEQKCIKFISIPDYQITEDGLISEIEMTVVFEILENLEYLENLIEYKDNNLL